MKLRATTLLGENTTPLLADLCTALGELGLEVEFDAELDWSARRNQVEAGGFDLVWACGLLTAELIDSGVGLDVVAAPVFPGEDRAVYRSVIVSRPESGYESLPDALDGRLAVNEYGSWSGWHAYVDHLREAGLDVADHSGRVFTGGHRNSAHALVDGVVDVASIDSTLWTFMLEDDSGLGCMKALDTTRDWPAPPLSLRTGLDDDVATALRDALLAATPTSGQTLEATSSGPYEAMLKIIHRP